MYLKFYTYICNINYFVASNITTVFSTNAHFEVCNDNIGIVSNTVINHDQQYLALILTIMSKDFVHIVYNQHVLTHISHFTKLEF